MITAIQELIEWTNQYEGKMISADQVILKAYKMLEKEKEQIMFSYHYGKTNGILNNKTSEQFYNQTYKN